MREKTTTESYFLHKEPIECIPTPPPNPQLIKLFKTKLATSLMSSEDCILLRY